MKVDLNVVVLLGILCTSVALADYAPDMMVSAGFKTPSDNIHCVADKMNNLLQLRCDVIQNSAKPLPKPKDCELDWGNAFWMSDKEGPEPLCYGDTIYNPEYPIVKYGQTWQKWGFVCEITSKYVHCTNPKKHGFELSKSKQILF